MYASARFHTFLLEGVPDTAASLRKLGVGYVFYLRRRRSDPDDVLYRLAADPGAVVTDDYPAFVAGSTTRGFRRSSISRTLWSVRAASSR